MACSQPAPTNTWYGEHITVTSAEGITPCAGTIPFLDSYILHAHRFWGSMPNLAPFELELRQQTSDSEHGGLAASGTAWATADRSVLHEINHLVTHSEDGYSAPSLTEGIATALAPTDPFSMWGSTARSPEDFAFLERTEFGSEHYDDSAQLTRFLIQRYGVSQFRKAYQQARLDSSAEEIEEAYLSAFGDGIYDAFDEFDQAPTCGLRAWECERKLHPSMALPVNLNSPTDCSKDPTWIGANSSDDENWYPHRRFLVEFSKTTRIVALSENARVIRMTCDDECGFPPETPFPVEDVARTAGSESTPSTVNAGLHSFHISPIDPNLPFSVDIKQLE